MCVPLEAGKANNSAYMHTFTPHSRALNSLYMLSRCCEYRIVFVLIKDTAVVISGLGVFATSC